MVLVEELRGSAEGVDPVTAVLLAHMRVNKVMLIKTYLRHASGPQDDL